MTWNARNTWTAQNIPSQEGRIAVVTGANSGIGYETALQLAAKGAKVILACRSESRGTAARQRILDQYPHVNVEVRVLDLGSLDSVRSFAQAFLDDHDQLDLLINNAGIMVPPLTRTAEGFEVQFGVNHLGHFALTALLLPLLDKTSGSRIVNVSSMAHRGGRMDFHNLNAEKGYRPMAAYGQSKLANLLFTYELQRRLAVQGSEVQVLAAHPGWTATNLQAHAGWVRALNPIFGMQPEDGALPTLRAATSPEARGGEYYGPKGLFEMRGAPRRVRSNRRSYDRQSAVRLWSVSEQLTGIPLDLPATTIDAA